MSIDDLYAGWRRRVVEAGGIGLVVKAGFPIQGHPAYDCEWMFVEVTALTPDGRLLGRLLNRPAYGPGQHGDTVEVGDICSAEVPAWGSDELRQRWRDVVAADLDRLRRAGDPTIVEMDRLLGRA